MSFSRSPKPFSTHSKPQIAGAYPYPGVDTETSFSLSSDPSAELGQWNYDFSDPNSRKMGAVALPSMASSTKPKTQSSYSSTILDWEYNSPNN